MNLGTALASMDAGAGFDEKYRVASGYFDGDGVVYGTYLNNVAANEAEMRPMLEDLRESLPTIMNGVTPDVLEAVEQDRFGARKAAPQYFGSDYFKRVDVSPFST